MRVILGLGGNEGNRLGKLRAAVQALAPLAASPLYESDALLPPEAPADGSWNLPFLNLAVEIETELSPEALLVELKTLEKRLGREERARWAPRSIDIDILAIEDEIVRGGALRIPHPGLLDRPFALLPLFDLRPEWRHPEAQDRATELERLWRGSPSDRVPSRTRRSPHSLCALVGILNVTPDSFSDGGRFLAPEAARAQAAALRAAGAAIVDIGAESTRPQAQSLSADEEWRRLAPVLEALEGHFSVDTRHAETAARAIGAGAAWINDVEGLSSREMRRAVADSSVDLVVMHSLGVPPSSARVLPLSRDPVDELLAWGEAKLRELEGEGISRSRVILDPGIGFGKTAQQNWLLLAGTRRLHELGARILVGHSRKSFLALLTDRLASERDLETRVLDVELARQGTQFLRVHDVPGAARALGAWSLVDGVSRWR